MKGYCCAELLGLREFSIKWKRVGKVRSWHYMLKECPMYCSGRGLKLCSQLLKATLGLLEHPEAMLR